MLDLKALFEKNEHEFLAFEKVDHPRHQRPDICAFLMLHDLAQPARSKAANQMAQRVTRMVRAAEHDEIWLDADVALLAASATEDDIVTLIRCGIRLDAESDALAMFV